VSATGVCPLSTGETREEAASVRPPESAPLCHAGDAVAGTLLQPHSPEKFFRVRSDACLSTSLCLVGWHACRHACRRWQWGIERESQDSGLDSGLETWVIRPPGLTGAEHRGHQVMGPVPHHDCDCAVDDSGLRSVGPGPARRLLLGPGRPALATPQLKCPVRWSTNERIDQCFYIQGDPILFVESRRFPE